MSKTTTTAEEDPVRICLCTLYLILCHHLVTELSMAICIMLLPLSPHILIIFIFEIIQQNPASPPSHIKSEEHLYCHVRNVSRVFKMPLKILGGCLSSEENDKQTSHDIALPSATHHSYFPCYNII